MAAPKSKYWCLLESQLDYWLEASLSEELTPVNDIVVIDCAESVLGSTRLWD